MLIGLLIALVVLVAGYLFVRGRGAEADVVKDAMVEAEKPAIVEESDTAIQAVKTITVTGKNFSLSPAEIRVKKGDKVKIVFQNESGFHDWVIDEFNARTQQFMGPGTQEVEFVADKTGEFEYYCSVGQHRKMGMKGKLIVE